MEALGWTKRNPTEVEYLSPATYISNYHQQPLFTLPLGNQVDQAALVLGQGGGAGLGVDGCDDAGGALVNGQLVN